MSTAVREGREARVHRATLPVIMLALATVVSAVASLNVAIPSIARDTHATQTQLSWIIDAYAWSSPLCCCSAARSVTDSAAAGPCSAVSSSSAAASAAAMTVSGPTSLIALRGLLGRGGRPGHAGDAVDDHQHLSA